MKRALPLKATRNLNAPKVGKKAHRLVGPSADVVNMSSDAQLIPEGGSPGPAQTAGLNRLLGFLASPSSVGDARAFVGRERVSKVMSISIQRSCCGS